MSAPLRLLRVTRTRNAAILLAHTAVLATLGTLVTGTDAQVRKLGRAMSLGNREYELRAFCEASQRPE